MLTLIIFIVVLLVTVISHEWGHYITAKKSGMFVEEFGFGIPPKLFSWKRGETEYSINALPLGGFVRIAGENGLDNSVPYERQFESKPWYKQALVLVAGVACNILLAILLFTISYSIGTPTISDTGTSTVIAVTSGSPTEKAGIKVGDTIVNVSKNETVYRDIDTSVIRTIIQDSLEPIGIEVMGTQKVSRTVYITPEKTADGILLGIGVEKIELVKTDVLSAFTQALKQTLFVTKSIFSTVGNLLASLVTPNSKTEGLVGPIGLAREVRNASNIGFTYLLSFTAMISINLAVVNILPFPALDGGRLLIVILERLTRKKFSKKVVTIIHTTGFALLLLLMIILSVGDIGRLL